MGKTLEDFVSNLVACKAIENWGIFDEVEASPLLFFWSTDWNYAFSLLLPRLCIATLDLSPACVATYGSFLELYSVCTKYMLFCFHMHYDYRGHPWVIQASLRKLSYVSFPHLPAQEPVQDSSYLRVLEDGFQ